MEDDQIVENGAGDEQTPEEIAAAEQAAKEKKEAEEGAETSEQKIERLEKEKAEAEKKSKEQYEARKRAEKQRDEALGGLKPIDVMVLTQANVHSEDIETVTKWASFNKISITEALKDSTLKTVLDARAEERKTAAATQTRGGARGAAETSGEELLRKAETTGEVPETTEGMQKLFLARQQRKVNKRGASIK